MDEHSDYMAEFEDPEIGSRFLRATDDTIQLLARHPRIGRVSGVTSRTIEGMRILRIRDFPKYLVCYHVTKRGVEVLRIVHGARDLEHLFDE